MGLVIAALFFLNFFLSGRAEIEQTPNSQRLQAGATATFACNANILEEFFDGFKSSLTIQWKREELVINHSPDQRFRFDKNFQTFSIRNLTSRDTGRYSCDARRGSNYDTLRFQVVVEDVPDPPSDVRLTACDGRVAQIQWKLDNDNNSPVTQFRIEFNNSFRPQEWRVAKTHLPRDRTHQRIALSPWGNYTFRVLAENSVGISKPSKVTRKVCSTSPEVPHINPKGVCTLNNRPHTLAIKWEPMPPEEHNAPGFHYLVRWKRHDIGDSSTEEKIVNASSNSLLVTGVSVYKPYEIYVLAYNEHGAAVAPPRMDIYYSGEDVPLEVPQNFKLDDDKPVTDKTADFTWSAVNTGPWRIQGYFRGYKIQFWKTEEYPINMREHSIIYREPPPCWNNDASTSGSNVNNRLFTSEVVRKKRDGASLGHVYNLWPHSNITAQIVVLNAKYSGPPSKQVYFRTKEGVPGPLQSFTVTERGVDYLRLEWTNPKAINGVLDGYTVTYMVSKSPTQFSPHTKLQTVHIEPEEYGRLQLIGLLPDHLYGLTICARTKVGCGPVSSIESRTLADGPPTPPDVSIVIINNKLLNVSWLIPDDPSTVAATGYYVHFRKLGQASWETSREQKDQSWLLLEDLEDGAMYEVRVIAKNGEESGSPESASRIKRIGIGRKKESISQPTFRALYNRFNAMQIGLDHTDDFLVTSYKVEHRLLGSEQWSSTPSLLPHRLVTISDVIPGGRYEARVVVTTDTGDTITSSSRVVTIGRNEAGIQASYSSSGSKISFHSLSPFHDFLVVSYVLTVVARCASSDVKRWI